jgi:DNA polymerase-3 subunit beta
VIIRDDMQIGIQLVFLTEMLTNLQSDMIMLEMSLPNRAGILTLLMD